ncbi:YmfQ family protein [Gluconacetobacter sp. 1c LMG 22058]|uniref:YmfQ family protein n=1 Tax=Gluconacetobacter dulcium TaxID=2729096 RepID=A0A7W4JXI0_9PROT|nr:putative phage tail protein [Gluconacetobacter dulcium]MBB2196548.1 YmfQ family protein [Gluconacetobacter dulcium]
MALPSFSAGDFRQAILSLLPRGAVWSRDSDGLLSRLAAAWAPTYARSSARAVGLLTDSFPATTVELLPEWEGALGLPDPCAGTDATVEQRRAQVVATLVDTGGSSVAYYTNLAASLGYTVDIVEYAPARAGWLAANGPVYAEAWAYAWTMVVRESSADAVSVAVLRCEMQRRAPAHTAVLFYPAA